MTKSTENLICFDLDGVLISSMVIANQIFYEVISRKLGLPLHDYPKRKDLMALSAEERVIRLWADEIREMSITQEHIDKALQAYRDEKMAVGIPLLPHAKEAVELMAQHFEFLACVSSNPDYIIDETLSRLGIRQHFAKITGLDHVHFSKPHPEMYAVTADHFGMEPERCLVFEDSTHGINSARGAGMRVVGVATGLESEADLEKAQPEKILSDFSQLSIDLVRALL